MFRNKVRPIPADVVQKILETTSLYQDTYLYKNRKRLPIQSIKPILELHLKDYAKNHHMTTQKVSELLLKFIHDYHQKKSLPKEIFVSELEFELNNFHHNNFFPQ